MNMRLVKNFKFKIIGKLYFFISLLILLNSESISANELNKQQILVSNGYTNQIRPGQKSIAIYINKIENKLNLDVDLIKVTSTFPGEIEIHSMKVVDNLMKMKKEQTLSIPSGTKVSLGRGNQNGYHLMFQNENKEFRKNSFTINLHFSNGDILPCKVIVKKNNQDKHNHH